MNHPLSKKDAEEMKHVLQVAVRAWGDHAGRTRLRPDASINEPKAPRGTSSSRESSFPISLRVQHS